LARSVSRGTVKGRARALANVVNDPNVTEAEVNGLFDVHVGAYWDLLNQSGVSDFSSTTSTFSCVVGQTLYPLSTIAPDLLSLTAVYAVDSPDLRRPIDPFNERQRGLFKPPQQAWNIEIEYIPCAPLLTEDAQTIDGVDGWDVLVSNLMARDICAKRGRDPGLILANIAAAEKRIASYGSMRYRGGPKYLSSDTPTNWWYPPVTALGGWRLRGTNLELYDYIALGWPV
jgi:hypothetical protein